MKSKFLPCLALVLSGTFLCFLATQSVYGYVVVQHVNHANLKTDFSFLKIKTVRFGSTNAEKVLFIVIVIPKTKQQSGHVEWTYTGNLGISDTNGFIAGVSVQGRKITGELPEVPEPLMEKCVVFEFLVADKYLEKSEFRVEEVLVSGKTGQVAGDGEPPQTRVDLLPLGVATDPCF
jgi:hypothetical protein